MTQKVFVIDADGKQLLPTHPARARKLVQAGRAQVHQVVPFTIQLARVVENPVGTFTVGIDDGAKHVGIAMVNEHTKEVVFRGTVRLRQDVTRKMTQRAAYRRTRRNRKLRHRPARFLNRGRKGFLSPTIRQKKDSILRVIRDLGKVLHITKAVVEEGQFDISSMAAGRKLVGAEFQQSEYEGRNFRAKVLWRDRYKCTRCSSTEWLQAHHIKPKSVGGGNSPSNGLTLCRTCHKELHDGLWVLTARPKRFLYPAHLQAGKKYLREGLRSCGLAVNTCCGWMTKLWRDTLKLPKAHDLDAVAMVCRAYRPTITERMFTIIPRRTKVWEDNPTKKCHERMGFRHWDLVRARHRSRGVVVGSVRSLKERGLTLRTHGDSNFPVSYSKTQLLWRPKGLVYIGVLGLFCPSALQEEVRCVLLWSS